MVCVLCFHCQSDRLVKDGRSRGGKQQYKCRECGRRSTQNPQGQGHSEEYKAQILALYFERPSMRGIQRATGERRLANLRSLVEAQGSGLFWFSTFEAVGRTGPLSAMWQKPPREGANCLTSLC